MSTPEVAGLAPWVIALVDRPLESTTPYLRESFDDPTDRARIALERTEVPPVRVLHSDFAESLGEHKISAERLEDEHLDAFGLTRDEALGLLEVVALPLPSPVTAAEPAVAD